MNRLKLVSVLFAGALLVGACKQEPAYKVSGTVADPVFEEAKVYLTLGDDPFKRNVMDSTVVSGGKYVFEGGQWRSRNAGVLPLRILMIGKSPCMFFLRWRTRK